ncbi:DUF397 domain-containing protein [Streptomyces sp. CA-111067]|uniref:DUF397 domain-containing protein n=1 Tax=Streptomyces sp. CA-111067 TaxID=3240046 RepID=UPI003D962E9B
MHDLSGAEWFTSSYSNDQGGNCIEAARLTDDSMAVRDSKDPQGPALTFPPEAWRAFASAARRGEFPTA